MIRSEQPVPMASETTYLEFSDVGSGAHKFYEVSLDGPQVTIRFGRIGTNGRAEARMFSSSDEARHFADIKVGEKLKAGYRQVAIGATQKQPVVKPALDDEVGFWKLIQASRRGSDGDPEIQCQILQAKLARLSLDEILAFERVMDRLMTESYRADLWGAAYIINGGCSDDGFDYFRGWLVLQGEKVFRDALENPDSLARVSESETECEGALSVAALAYEEKTGRDDFYSRCPVTGGPPELQGNLSDWDNGSGDVDPLKARRLYPRLYQRFMA